MMKIKINLEGDDNNENVAIDSKKEIRKKSSSKSKSKNMPKKNNHTKEFC